MSDTRIRGQCAIHPHIRLILRQGKVRNDKHRGERRGEMEVPTEFVELLSSTLSADQDHRVKAEEQLQSLEKTELRALNCLCRSLTRQNILSSSPQ